MTNDLSRRKLTVLLSALAVPASAAPGDKLPILPSKVYGSGQVPYRGDAAKKSREFFNGLTHSGFNIECHETNLGPGVQTHPPHKHEHEEVMVITEGAVEAYIDGATQKAEQGSVLYFASNQMHSVRNAGDTTCRYYVLELRGTASSG